ncbi:MAG: trypsin-like peptidase domain-containing protein [Chromatiaceae bacterium]|nr:trypsin-like peptidase domain-containing protein [Chromatiaceae bacterium]MCP5314901.1 trypsin-like peptidase domain-containing protein [Chromatiaceae bacterium]
MANRRKLLRDLLLTLFRSNDDLYAAIDSLDYAQMPMLLAGLPGANSSRIAFTITAVEQLEAHGLVTAPFFQALTVRYPARAALIDSVHRSWTGAGVAEEGDFAPAPDADATEVSAAHVATHEKIMGERPTFLDVAYLKHGYETARSVVKLRMRFAGGWYSGTGFLISSTQLLTVHHNFQQPSGETAQEITALFDYERAIDGPEAEGTPVPCKLDSIHGEAADDWAVIELAEPRPDRPPAHLSDEPVRAEDRVAIIQHPNGMAKQVAMHNNLVTFADDKRVQYLTDTLPGSSGAPVFDMRWRVVALHHAGGDLLLPGTKQLVYRNQGSAIARVRARMAAHGIVV